MGKCCCFFKVLGALVVALGISGFISYFVLSYGRGKALNYQVTNASLTQFNLTTNNYTLGLLKYNLALNMTIENPNKKGGYHYDRFEAVARFKNQTLNNLTWNPLYLGHNKMVEFSALFKGERLMALPLGGDEVGKFKDARVFDVLLKLFVKQWTKVGTLKVHHRLQYACYLKVPLNSDMKSAESFKVTKCDQDSSNQ